MTKKFHNICEVAMMFPTYTNIYFDPILYCWIVYCRPLYGTPPIEIV